MVIEKDLWTFYKNKRYANRDRSGAGYTRVIAVQG